MSWRKFLFHKELLLKEDQAIKMVNFYGSENSLRATLLEPMAK